MANSFPKSLNGVHLIRNFTSTLDYSLLKSVADLETDSDIFKKKIKEVDDLIKNGNLPPFDSEGLSYLLLIYRKSKSDVEFRRIYEVAINQLDFLHPNTLDLVVEYACSAGIIEIRRLLQKLTQIAIQLSKDLSGSIVENIFKYGNDEDLIIAYKLYRSNKILIIPDYLVLFVDLLEKLNMKNDICFLASIFKYTHPEMHSRFAKIFRKYDMHENAVIEYHYLYNNHINDPDAFDTLNYIATTDDIAFLQSVCIFLLKNNPTPELSRHILWIWKHEIENPEMAKQLIIDFDDIYKDVNIEDIK